MVGVRRFLPDGLRGREIAGGSHEPQIFRYRRDSGPCQWSDHTGARAQGGAGGRSGVSARRSPPPCRHRQGYAALRLHDRIRHGGRVYLGRHGRAAARSDADAGGGDADQVDARRSRRDDFSLPQSVRGQRHQAVRPAGFQIVRRRREADRAVARRADRPQAGAERQSRARPPHRRRSRPLHRIRQAHPAARTLARRSAGGDRLRQRRGLQGGAGSAVGTGCRRRRHGRRA